MDKVLIIGAGGVTSYLLPVFLKTFRETEVVLMDGDKLEARNLDRQLFSHSLVGTNKAQALIYMQEDAPITGISKFFTGECHGHQFDAVICCADNHEARKNALQFADDRRIPCFIGGNEYFDSQAMFYDSSMVNSPADPRVKFPEILTDKTGSPTSCQGVEQESSPQLAIANHTCASFILQLLWVHIVKKPDMGEEYRSCLPVEHHSCLTRNESVATEVMV